MDIEKLKKDKEFLQNLQDEKQKALKSKDIVKMYDVLDTMLALDLDDEDIDRLYEAILEVAFDRLGDMLMEGKKFDFGKEADEYTARAMYEHAIERWDRRDFNGAKELFGVLSFLVPQKWQEAMAIPLVATAKRMELDKFLQEFVDKEKIGEENIFLDAFTDNAKKFFAQNSEVFKEELAKMEKLG